MLCRRMRRALSHGFNATSLRPLFHLPRRGSRTFRASWRNCWDGTSGAGSGAYRCATGWGAAVLDRRGGKRRFWIDWVGRGGFGSMGWGSGVGGAARSGGFRSVGGRAGRHRQGRLDCHQALCGDSGQPLPRYEPWWPHDEPWCAVVAARSPTCAPRRQLASPLGSYRGRGCPKSPPKLSYSSRHRRRCRPARPPTPQNPPLRAAPHTIVSHPLNPQNRRSPPRATPSIRDAHRPDDPRCVAPACAPTIILPGCASSTA
jgi:hypothetical protein